MLHWQCCSPMIAQVPVKKLWKIWVNTTFYVCTQFNKICVKIVININPCKMFWSKFPRQEAIPAGRAVSVASDKRWKFLPVTLAHIDGLVQDCSISSALAMEILLSCTNHRYNNALWHKAILTYIQTNQSQNIDASQLEAMSVSHPKWQSYSQQAWVV